MSKVKIDCHKIIGLYDTRQKTDGGFATAVSSIGGEELGLALLQHYLESQNKSVQRLLGVPTTGSKIGNRLDGWFVVDGELMQVEVKNWGANALGGIHYDGDWAGGWNQFLRWFKARNLQKVLLPMRPPTKYIGQVKHATACMWPVMHPQGEKSPYFTIPLNDLPELSWDAKPFTELNVFSMSSYLRHLNCDSIELEMPLLYSRLQRMSEIFSLSS